MNKQKMKLFFLVLNMLSTGYLSAALFDKSINDRDCAVLVWLTKRGYDRALPGAYGVAKTETYITVALFDPAGALVKVLSFPAGLTEGGQPTLVQFMPRGADNARGRELLTIENGKIIKYTLWAEKDPANKQVSVSVDFGKRTPLVVDGFDATYMPRSDDNGDVYFKVNPTPFGSKKWCRVGENVVAGETNVPEPRPIVVDESSGVLTADGMYTVSISHEAEIIDPLGIDEVRMKAPYADYGTAISPVTPIDYQLVIDTFQMGVGKLLILRDRLNNGEKIVFDHTVNLTSEQRAVFEQAVKDMSMAYDKKKGALADFKLIARECGTKNKLKKWLNNAEVSAILSALTPRSGAGVVVELPNQGRAVSQDGVMVLPLGYYRKLRKYIKAPRQADWEAYSKFGDVKRALESYPKTTLGHAKIVELIKQLSGTSSTNWKQWFVDNKNLAYELLLDYLIQLDEAALNKVLDEAGLTNMIKKNTFKLMVNAYKADRP